MSEITGFIGVLSEYVVSRIIITFIFIGIMSLIMGHSWRCRDKSAESNEETKEKPKKKQRKNNSIKN